MDPLPEVVYHPELCIHCGHCAEGCYTGARMMCGREMTVRQVLESVLADRVYYGKDGGLTVSGGEPTMQPEFLLSLFQSAKEAGLHCAIETNLSASFDSVIRPLLPLVDLWMADLKCFDAQSHRQWTGADNERVKENFRLLSESGAAFVMRTPIIPGVNDSAEALEPIIRFAASLPGLQYYEALPYHPLGQSKHCKGSSFTQRFPQPDRKMLLAMLTELTERYGIPFRFANVDEKQQREDPNDIP